MDSNVDFVGVRCGVGAIVDVRADILAHKFDEMKRCRQSRMYEIDLSLLLIKMVQAAFRKIEKPLYRYSCQASQRWIDEYDSAQGIKSRFRSSLPRLIPLRPLLLLPLSLQRFDSPQQLIVTRTAWLPLDPLVLQQRQVVVQRIICPGFCIEEVLIHVLIPAFLEVLWLPGWVMIG